MSIQVGLRLLLVAAVASSCYRGVTIVPAVHGLTSIVTGANGYVGRAVVQELLSRCQIGLEEDNANYILCLVRNRHVASEQNYWKKQQDLHFSGTNSHSVIQVLPYDMLDQGASLEAALQTAPPAAPKCIFHIASVFGPKENHTQTALDNVRGTEDLIRTLAKVGNCKLILTSSMAAVRGTGQEPLNSQFYTSLDWNTVSTLASNNNWGSSYQWSKAESERRAWELCRQYDISMVSLCPSFVFGPPLPSSQSAAAATTTASSSYSCQLVDQWVYGQSPVQSRLFIDVRDVAKAHVEASLRAVAVGQRYIVSTEARVPSRDLAGWLQEVCRSTGLADPTKIHYDADFAGGSIPIGDQEVEACTRLQRDLGISLRPVKDTISDMALAILENQANAQIK
jgi:nucleoside-diphosphate-sugar epimerase